MLERVTVKKIHNRYREAAALATFWGRTNKKEIAGLAWAITIVVGLGVLAVTSSREGSLWASLTKEATAAPRAVQSLSGFPSVRQTSDADDILQTYPAYLQFALEIGKDVDSANSKRLANSYENLRRRHPQGAVRFLKGLRFEMVQKLELMGVQPNRISTRTPEMRRWVAKFMKEWARESDEYLFRAVATPRAE